MAKRRDWTIQECRVLTAAYAFLLNAELSGARVNKSAIRRATLPKLDNRSAGSYEMKMCNISAALAEHGLPIVQGYKPRSSYQRALHQTIREAIDAGILSADVAESTEAMQRMAMGG